MAKLRNMKEGMKKLFDLFAKYIGQTDCYVDKRRIITKTFSADKDDFSKTTIVVKKEIQKNMLMLTAKRDKSYILITIGYKELTPPPGISPIDTTLGIFLQIILSADIKFKDYFSKEEIENDVLYPPLEDDIENIDYDLEEIKKYFPEVNVYSIEELIHDNNSTEVWQNQLIKYVIGFYTLNRDLFELKFTDNILGGYIQIVNSDFITIDYDNLLRSITSKEWRFCFFELYRIIEPLYEIGKTLDFGSQIKSKLPLTDLYEIMYKNSDLRSYYREETEIKYLFNDLISSELKEEFKSLEIINTYKNYYTLRNDIVHGRKRNQHEISVNTEEEWIKLIQFLLKVILELYDFFDEDLKGFNPKRK